MRTADVSQPSAVLYKGANLYTVNIQAGSAGVDQVQNNTLRRGRPDRGRSHFLKSTLERIQEIPEQTMSTPNPEPGAPNATPPEGTPQPTPTPAPAPAPAAPPPSPAPAPVFDAAYVKTLRDEAADYRTKFREAETKLTETTTKLSALESSIQNQALELAIGKSGKVADAETALALIDRSKIELDDKGKPKNLDALLDDLVAAKPFLKPTPGVGPTPPTNPARTGLKFTLEQVKAMSQAEINANWEEVQATLTAHGG